MPCSASLSGLGLDGLAGRQLHKLGINDRARQRQHLGQLLSPILQLAVGHLANVQVDIVCSLSFLTKACNFGQYIDLKYISRFF